MFKVQEQYYQDARRPNAMTSQELATKLKEAGYPNKHGDATFCTNLHELIEECGDGFIHLRQDDLPDGKVWTALGQRFHEDGRKHDQPCITANSKEEAMVDLWVALKGK